MTSSDVYAAIDLKSFYASAECVARNLDPLTTNLVVADETRTEKTICLAVSPSLKSYGIPGRPRLYEVIRKVEEINRVRLREAIRQSRAVWEDGKPHFSGLSTDNTAICSDPSLELSYIIAPPRMKYYMDTSARIYSVYLKYIAPEDIHVYSIDEVFLHLTPYLNTYGLTPRDLVTKILREVLSDSGITATAGIGTNLYLAKLAMDIVAKHTEPDKDGVRIAELDEVSFREKLWDYKPLTAFWMTGPGTAQKLKQRGIHTMGELARASLQNQEWFYKTFGVNAEILIDHAWGIEPCTIAEIKAYRPSSTSVGEGQVLSEAYTNEKARIVVQEMTENLIFQLVGRNMVAGGLTLHINYDRENCENYQGETQKDYYGRTVPKSAHGTISLNDTNLGSQIMEASLKLFDRITDNTLTVRRIYLTAIRLKKDEGLLQISLFEDTRAQEKEKALQNTLLELKRKYGKNTILRGVSFEEGATMQERNRQIGGHRE